MHWSQSVLSCLMILRTNGHLFEAVKVYVTATFPPDPPTAIPLRAVHFITFPDPSGWAAVQPIDRLTSLHPVVRVSRSSTLGGADAISLGEDDWAKVGVALVWALTTAVGREVGDPEGGPERVEVGEAVGPGVGLALG